MTRMPLVLGILAGLMAACGPAVTTTGAAAPAPGASLRFARRPPLVGAKFQEISRMHLQLTLSVDPTGAGQAQTTAIEIAESEQRDEETLAVGSDAVTKVRVTYAEKGGFTKEGAEEKRERSPLASKTFVVENQGGSIVVLDERAQPAPAAEAKEVQKAYQSLGKPDPVTLAMPTRSLAPGERVDELARAIHEMMGRDPQMGVSDVAVAFKRAASDEGVFDVALRLVMRQGPMHFTVDLKGDLTVKAASSMPSQLALSGPVSVTAAAAGAALKLSGSGQMEMFFGRSAR